MYCSTAVQASPLTAGLSFRLVQLRRLGWCLFQIHIDYWSLDINWESPQRLSRSSSMSARASLITDSNLLRDCFEPLLLRRWLLEEIELSRVEPEGIEVDARRRFMASLDGDSSESLLSGWNDILLEGFRFWKDDDLWLKHVFCWSMRDCLRGQRRDRTHECSRKNSFFYASLVCPRFQLRSMIGSNYDLYQNLFVQPRSPVLFSSNLGTLTCFIFNN